MTQKWTAIAAIGAALLLAIGCKGEDSLSLDDYLQRVEDLGEEQERKDGEIEPPSFDDYDDERDYLDAVTDERRERAAVLEDSVDELERLSSPAESEDAHDRYVESLSHVLSAFDELIQALEESTSIDEANEVIDDLNAEGSELSNAIADGNEACRDLQDLADDNDVDVDLACQDSQ